MKYIRNHLSKILLLLFVVSLSCQDKNKKMNEKFKWSETISCSVGYPIDVFMGGLESANGGFTSLYLGVHTGIGGWGSQGRSMSNSVKAVPNRLNVIWISYAEKSFYELDTEIDYDKMLDLFRKGYYALSSNKKNLNPLKREYSTINVGFAPGGTVVVWLSGIGRQIEIGRYQGKKTSIAQEEIDKMEEGPEKNMCKPEYQQWIMENPGIVPPEVQEANKDKPIPFSLWDSYRKKYNWRLNFIHPENGVTNRITYFLYNAEMEILFGDYQIEKYQIIPKEQKWNTPKERAIPRQITFSWMEGDILKSGAVLFDEEQIFSAFQQIFGEDGEGEGEITIRINMAGNDAAVLLSGNGKEIGLYKAKVDIF